MSENNSQLLSVATFSETDVVTSMEYPTTGNTGGSWGMGGSFPQGGMTEQEYELYSLDKTDIASVTPQDNVTVNLEISEMDIPLLSIGMTAEVKMDALGGEKFTATITADDILTVPVEALVEEKKQTVIYTGYDEDKEELINPVTVTLGTSDGQMVEIVDGLESGMTYYCAYYDTLEISFAPDFGGGFNGNLFGR